MAKLVCRASSGATGSGAGCTARHRFRPLRRMHQDSANPTLRRCSGGRAGRHCRLAAAGRAFRHRDTTASRRRLTGSGGTAFLEPYAFGERDEGTLEILAGRILSALECAGQVAATPVNTAASTEPKAAEAEQEIAPEILEQLPPRRFDFATWALGAAVIICAVMLGMLLGRHYTAQKTTRSHRVVIPAHSSAIPSATPTAPVQAKASGPAVPPAAARPAAVKASSASAVPPGGLRVYDNGKEVFRLPPVERAGGCFRRCGHAARGCAGARAGY